MDDSSFSTQKSRVADRNYYTMRNESHTVIHVHVKNMSEGSMYNRRIYFLKIIGIIDVYVIREKWLIVIKL